MKAAQLESVDETGGLEVEQKIKISRSWAAWPEALKIAIINSLVEELDRPRLSKSAVFKMSAEQWKKHVANDHLPFSRECVACLEGSREVEASSSSTSA